MSAHIPRCDDAAGLPTMAACARPPRGPGGIFRARQLDRTDSVRGLVIRLLVLAAARVQLFRRLAHPDVGGTDLTLGVSKRHC
jgi:hypothetical protein